MSIGKILVDILGRENAYRLGRSLYMQSRNDIPNDIASNGERMVQRAIVDAWDFSAKKLVVVDCGANVGDWSLAFLEACGRSRSKDVELYAFEPVSSTTKVLRERLCHFSSVSIFEMALSSESGMTVMYVVGDGWGTNSLHSLNNGEEKKISITRITMFDFCMDNSIDTVHFLKCDAEGHDMDVIKGALPLLRQGRICVLQFEYNYRWILSRHFLRDVFGVVNGLPYRIGKVCPEHLELYDRWHPELERFFEGNYVLIKSDALEWFRTVECRLTSRFAVLPGRT